MKLKRKLTAAVLAAAGALTIPAAVAPPAAQASPLCTVLKKCGNIEAIGNHWIRVQRHYTNDMRWDRALYPGQGTQRTFKWADTDKIVLPYGTCLAVHSHVDGVVLKRYGSKTHNVTVKVADTFSFRVSAYFC